MLTKENAQLLAQMFDLRQLALDPAEIVTYEVDAGFDRAAPDGVFYPHGAADVLRVVQWARETGVPLVARGAGTGLAGGAVAERGGLVLEFARMDHISSIDTVGRAVTVEPGAVNLTLDTLARKHKLYYPPDPSSGRSSTLGGNLGTNAGGPHCFKYGVTANYVIGVEAVLADGRIVQFGGRTLDYPEYDMGALLVGSEGTLGIITRADLRLIRNPPGVKTMMVAFDSEAAAGVAVSAVIAAGLMPATLEMMDQRSMRMVDDFMETETGLPVHAGAALIVEVDGFPDSLDAQMEEVADIFAAQGGFDIRIAQTEQERERIWYGRKSAAGAFSRLAPSYYLTDVTVPRSQLGDVMAQINEICTRYDVTTCNFFHAGDGNLHPLILCDSRDAELMQRVHRAGEEIIALCIARDGSITGEHGVGMEKRPYMPAMYSPAELSAMRDVKEVFDPAHILNPGKILPDESETKGVTDRDAGHVGVTPISAQSFAPFSAVEAAAGLRALSESRTSVRIGGEQTGDPGSAKVWLSTANLCGVHKFAPADFYVTAGAGTKLADLQGFLHEHALQVALAAPWPDTTLGGLLSTNLNGPLRLRYGSLRDTLLCATVALADGRVIRAGRPVVKNVAGYDLPKVFVGAHGTLGLLIDVSLKLTPTPRSRRTLAIPVHELKQGLIWSAALAPHALTAAALVLCHHGLPSAEVPDAAYFLFYTAEGIPADVQSELAEVRTVLAQVGAPDAIEVETTDGVAQWRRFLHEAGPDEMVVRVGVPPQHMQLYMQMLGMQRPDSMHVLLDPLNGMMYARHAPADAAAAQRGLDGLRQPALALRGYAVALSVPEPYRATVDPWGYTPDGLEVMHRLKARWDPAGILNPGVFTVG